MPISPPGGGGGGGVTPICPGLLSRQSIFRPFSRRPKSTYDRLLETKSIALPMSVASGLTLGASTGSAGIDDHGSD